MSGTDLREFDGDAGLGAGRHRLQAQPIAQRGNIAEYVRSRSLISDRWRESCRTGESAEGELDLDSAARLGEVAFCLRNRFGRIIVVRRAALRPVVPSPFMEQG